MFTSYSPIQGEKKQFKIVFIFKSCTQFVGFKYTEETISTLVSKMSVRNRWNRPQSVRQQTSS